MVILSKNLYPKLFLLKKVTNFVLIHVEILQVAETKQIN